MLEAKRLVDEFPKTAEYRHLLGNSLSSQGTQQLWWGTQNEECAKSYEQAIELLNQLEAESTCRAACRQSNVQDRERRYLTADRKPREPQGRRLGTGTNSGRDPGTQEKVGHEPRVFVRVSPC